MKLDVNISVRGDLMTQLESIPANLRAAVERKFSAGLEEVYHKAIGVLSNGKYTSTQEVQLTVERRGDSLVGSINPITIKTRVQEYGGKSYYEILPTKARALRFIGRSGEVVFAQRVFHPPVRGKHYISETIAAELPHLKSILIQGTVDEVIHRYGPYAGSRYLARVGI